MIFGVFAYFSKFHNKNTTFLLICQYICLSFVAKKVTILTYILKTMKNKFEANIAQSKMQSEKMLKTMQQLSADAVYTGAFEMSLDEINAEIEAVRNGL